ncbi:glycoside hydrolase family 2 TIM barrel-domain containing protein [Dysgonomonas sp. 520]|uniref:glycoside hydrolase family 2 protein n=1 Tax=Dysgonomonas sp. 520 TaxID=2302931 RepID=UPI0013D51570|nr:glycoside hydrolase family 2 TIM barrel-domain containing protein [Dysgonomonas sp. 520]NDW09689.1 glycoside hydrolase family 2 [Dysgonomonas sp. 520]
MIRLFTYILSIFFFLFINNCINATNYQPEFSVAGFYNLENSGRTVYNFNVGWRFMKGDIKGAEKLDFDDSRWDVVSTPHTVQLVPAEASGGRNYQGPAWYRKHFVVDESLKDKLINIYFEAAMGKSVVYLNGEKVAEHLGGYLPFSIELTQHGVKAGDKCLIAVLVDNSDNRDFPPGKKQATLDFTYHGGIYRDVWMIATSKIHLTDPNKENKTAGGGIFVQYGEINKKKADLSISTDVKNSSNTTQSITIENKITDQTGKTIKTLKNNVQLKVNESKQIIQKTTLDNPNLWYPDAPHLYKVETKVVSKNGAPLDGGITRIGIRKTEFRGVDGFWLNGEPADKLIGGNRHQDFAYVGNAMPNSQHWKDAKKLRDGGYRIIRVAHYPQDPSFMDACDELGMFVIVATPGWQYWNKDPQFAEYVYDDIRNMIRRDRNHPSVLMWEPILNETRFPLDFTLKAQQITHEEYPGSFCVADHHSAGVAENFEVVYGWPKDVGNFKQCIFTREFAENVDDWYAHNTNNRASRSWGEVPLLVQALQLAKAYDEMYPESRQFIGGAQWHPFDHQRGYHPDPYWGGVMDAFRQPKYSYYMFKSQVDAKLKHPLAETGPMVFIAHEISPFSGPDVTVFTNCDEVRLIAYETDTLIQKVPREKYGMPNPPVTFNNVYYFNDMRKYPYVEKQWQKVSFVAEGLIDGKVVCSTKKMPSRRSTKLRLSIDNAGQKLEANGSDFIPVICEVTDDEGNVRRYAKENILFSIEGEGEIIGNDRIGANPRAVEFGSAPVLVRSTLKAGKIKVNARVLFEGEHAPTPASIEFESTSSKYPLVYLEKPQINQTVAFGSSYQRQMTEEEKQKMLNEVELQQTEFGEKNTDKK